MTQQAVEGLTDAKVDELRNLLNEAEAMPNARYFKVILSIDQIESFLCALATIAQLQAAKQEAAAREVAALKWFDEKKDIAKSYAELIIEARTVLRNLSPAAAALMKRIAELEANQLPNGCVAVCEICDQRVDVFEEDGCGFVAGEDDDDDDADEMCPLRQPEVKA